MLLIVSLLGTTTEVLIPALGFFYGKGIVRVARAAPPDVIATDFIVSARARGHSNISIIINGSDITSSSRSFLAITNGFRVIFASGSSWVTSYSVVDSTAFTWTITATDAARNTKTLTGSSLDLTIDTTKPTVRMTLIHI